MAHDSREAIAGARFVDPKVLARVGNLEDPPKVAEKWGDYKDRDRRAIEAEVHTRLSGPWKKMVEEYYKKLNQGGDR